MELTWCVPSYPLGQTVDLLTKCMLKTNICLDLNKLLTTIDFPSLWFRGKWCSFWKIEVHHLMLNEILNVMTELAPKGPRFVEIIEIMDCLDISFITVMRYYFSIWTKFLHWLKVIYDHLPLLYAGLVWHFFINISGNTENGYQRFWKFLLTEDYILHSLPAGSLIVQEK